MDVKELRIGNYVMANLNDNYGFLIVSGEDLCGEEGDYLQPIPLTEEWLKRFGFEDFYSLEDEVRLTNWDIDIYKEEDYWMPSPYYFSNAFTDDFKLRWVHQLQNLYFALTGGEELVIKE